MGGLSSPYLGASFIDVEWQRLDVLPVTELFPIKTLANIGFGQVPRALWASEIPGVSV